MQWNERLNIFNYCILSSTFYYIKTTFENDMHAACACLFIIVIYKKECNKFRYDTTRNSSSSQQWRPVPPTTFFFLTLFPSNHTFHTLLLSLFRRDHRRREQFPEPTRLQYPQGSSQKAMGLRRRRIFAGEIEKLKKRRV